MKAIQSEITDHMVQGLVDKIDNLFAEGLEQKGFTFKNHCEKINFIKERCTCTDNKELKERVYLVDGIPFFLHKYEIIYEPITQDENGIKMSANYGSFAFL